MDFALVTSCVVSRIIAAGTFCLCPERLLPHARQRMQDHAPVIIVTAEFRLQLLRGMGKSRHRCFCCLHGRPARIGNPSRYVVPFHRREECKSKVSASITSQCEKQDGNAAANGEISPVQAKF